MQEFKGQDGFYGGSGTSSSIYGDIYQNPIGRDLDGGDDDFSLWNLWQGFSAILIIVIVATTVSAVAILGLLIPLSIQLKNGSSQRSEQPYSTYNLYLVFSAFADLFCSVCLMIEGPYAYMRYLAIITATIIANLWINAVVVYEVLVLLQASNARRRISQPSLMKVNLQGGGIIVGAILYAVVSMAFERLVFKNDYKGWVPFTITRLAVFCLLFLIPILYVIGVTIFVKRKAYLPPSNGATPRDKAVRGLALFFFRVILVFLMIWVPVFCLYVYFLYGNIQLAHYTWSLYLIAFQPIVNFCLILTKPDVKKYIKDLVTLSYIFGESTYCRCNCYDKTNATQGQRWRRTRTAILGFSFTGADSAVGTSPDGEEADENANDGNHQDIETGSAIGIAPDAGEDNSATIENTND